MRFLVRAISLLVLVAICGCSRTTWVDADPTGCDAQLVAHVNASHEARKQGTVICASHGDPGFAGKFRCSDHVLQAQCRR